MNRSKYKSKSLIEHFSVLPDPRLDRKKRHRLIDIIVISVCGIISGCDTFVDIEAYGNSKIDWLKQFLSLPNGIPSHDTIGRVFSLINFLDFQKAFYEWTRTLPDLKGEIINIDGKYINSSYGASRNDGKSIFGMVNAWASRAGVALAQVRTDFEKVGEKEAFRQLIDFLELKGAIVTMDANGCHADITNKIIEKEGDFVVALKRNQKALFRQAETLFLTQDPAHLESASEKDQGHGRIEMRECVSINLNDLFMDQLTKKTHQREQVMWKGLRSIARLSTERTFRGQTQKEVRYYVSSLKANACQMLEVVRSHWEVENKLHWVLDVAFSEDGCRVRNGYAGENLAVIRQLAVNLLRKETTARRSIKGKRLKCGWENDYLKTVITGMNQEEIVL